MILILIALGIISTHVHEQKGYSPVAGFFWGFLGGPLGLAVVLLEQTAEERKEAGKKELSVLAWTLIFVLIGVLILFIRVILPMFGKI